MTKDEMRDICRRALLDAFGKRDLAAIDGLYAPEMVEQVKKGSAMWHAVTPDLRYTVEDVIVEGNKGVVIWTCVGTHTGALWGIAPTGKKVTSAGILVLRVEGGKVVEGGGKWNALDYLIQLGAIPPMIAPDSEAWKADP
jgi:ketosteroid isomerase-like protein